MKSILNKTSAPLRIPLPRGKVLHLGPRKTGQINDPAADHPPILKLIEAGTLEVVADGAQGATGQGEGSAVHASTHGMGPNTAMKKTGDR